MRVRVRVRCAGKTATRKTGSPIEPMLSLRKRRCTEPLSCAGVAIGSPVAPASKLDAWPARPLACCTALGGPKSSKKGSSKSLVRVRVRVRVRLTLTLTPSPNIDEGT